jgi:SpoIID/LytB domain protein
MVIDRATPVRSVRRSRSRPVVLAAVLLALTAVAPVAQASPARPAAPLAARVAAVPAALVEPSAAAPEGPVDAEAFGVRTLGSTVTFHGRGAGHGVGMSQYGARGRAKAGESATRILAAYYRAARPATTDPTQTVRVLLLDRQPATAASPLVIHGRGGSWTVDGLDATFPAGAELRTWQPDVVLQDTSGPGPQLEVLAPDGTTSLFAGAFSTTVVVRPAGPATRLQLDAKPAAHDTYRGALKVVLSGTSARVVNRLALDDYLRGVVPAEMPSSWPGAALRAQAIASRSYAVRRLHPGSGAFDLYDDTRTQVYLGAEVETDRTNAMIDAAPGAILVKGLHDRAIKAFYHSTGGGATENNEYAFVGPSGAVTASPIAYLRGFADRAADGKAFDAASPYATWQTATLTRSQLSSILRRDARTNVGDVTKLDLTSRGVSGRLYRVTIYGSAGKKTVSANVFVAVYNAGRPAGSTPLRSTLFDTRPIG